jgi:hypothetical protein
MTIQFECPSCRKALKAPDETAGKKGKCPHCHGPIQVPEPVYEAEEYPTAEAIETTPGEADAAPAERGDRRPCPMCGEMIKATAAKCRFCGEILDEELRRSEKRKRAKKRDSDLSVVEYVCAILCSGIGCIIGIVWMIQGKPKGTKMFAISLISSIIWGAIRAALETLKR